MYANQVIMNRPGDNNDPWARAHKRERTRDTQIITKIFLYSKYTSDSDITAKRTETEKKKKVDKKKLNAVIQMYR